MKLEFSAGGIVFRKYKNCSKIALILDQYNNWTFPKGHIEKNEKKEKAALREVFEEIGIKDLKIIEDLGEIDYLFKFKGKLIHKFVYFYLMQAPVKSKVRLQKKEGIKKIKWVKPTRVLKNSTYKNIEPVLKKIVKLI